MVSPIIYKLVRGAREFRVEGATTKVEVSPPADSAANGVVGRPS